jgi:hypothetical protein
MLAVVTFSQRETDTSCILGLIESHLVSGKIPEPLLNHLLWENSVWIPNDPLWVLWP